MINGQGEKWWKEFYRVIEDLKKNGVRDINKYQPLWERENDVEKLYNDLNEDYKSSLQRRFFPSAAFQPIRCKNILVEGVTVINSPFWTINPEFCENVTVKRNNH